MDVVIVESPAKAKTINKYLGGNYKVFASFGHVRDLSPKDGSVIPEEDFLMKWSISSDSNKRLTEIAKATKEADRLILATDPDREGEAISWHILEVLKQKKVLKNKEIQRVVFNAITKNAVLEAMKNPRTIDTALVDAYLARRALDYLFGFTLSPILWRKLPSARSAGRVQSVALRLLCEREQEIERFVSKDYWTIEGHFLTPRKEEFSARLVEYKGEKLDTTDIESEEKATEIVHMLENAQISVYAIKSKPGKRNPYPPFTTSTLQQTASTQLGFSPSRTMQISQKLYEGIDLGGEITGLITYMRTDGVQMAPEAIEEARQEIAKKFNPKYLPEKPRLYSSKAKNAQEAHEAIRPTSFSRSPDMVKNFLDAEQLKLYTLIWKRAIASQMASAEVERTTIDLLAVNNEQNAHLRATGSVINFDGFLLAYSSDNMQDKDEENEETNKKLPKVEKNEILKIKSIQSSQHATEPPARFSEASLIKKLEELGIGRPSTYASILATLRDRGYMTVDKKRLLPEAKGRIVTAFLKNFFERYVEYDFTATLEDELDLISDGKLQWKDVLNDFWKNFTENIENIKDLRVSHVLDILNETLEAFLFPKHEDGSPARSCPQCKEGELSLKLGRFGAFLGCSRYPDCAYTKQLGGQTEGQNSLQADEPIVLGVNEKENEISLRTGRFGPYVQEGEGKNAKRMAIPKSWSVEEINFEKAKALLNLPREIGVHPETQEIITASIGRYGPYLAHSGKYVSLETIDDVFTIGINHAVTLLEQKKETKGKTSKTSSASILAELGEHPKGEKVTIRTGRYGPYINWKKINVPVPKTKEINEISLEEAVELITKKQEKAKK